MVHVVDEATRRKWRHVPNAISWARLVLGLFVIVVLILWPAILFDSWLSGWLAFMLAFVYATDWADGYIARKFEVTSKFGAMLDTTVDKVVVVIPIFWLAYVGVISSDYILGWWLASLTFARELAAIIGKFLARRLAGVEMTVQESGRFKMLLQCVGIVLTVWASTRSQVSQSVVSGAVAMALYSIYEYVLIFRRAREVKAA